MCTPVTRALLLSTYIKLVNLFPDLKAQARPAQHGATQYNMVQHRTIKLCQPVPRLSVLIVPMRTCAAHLQVHPILLAQSSAFDVEVQPQTAVRVRVRVCAHAAVLGCRCSSVRASTRRCASCPELLT